MPASPSPDRSATAVLSAYLTEHLAASTADLVALGVPASTLDRQRHAGFLTSLGHGVVGLAAVADPWRQRVAAARLVYPDAMLSHQTAAQLHGIRFHSTEVHVTAESGTRRKGEIRVHRSTFLPPHHRRSVDGFPVTSRARTICDLATEVNGDQHYRFLLRRSIEAGLVGRQSLLTCHAELATAPRPGAGRRLRVFRSLFSDEPEIAGSELERRFGALARSEGFDGIEYQFRPPWFDGVRGVVDVAFPAHKLIVELDGRRWHATLDAFENDRARDRVATEHGWRVLRFSWRDVVDHPELVIASIRRVLALS